jgi:hypothetical protein
MVFSRLKVAICAKAERWPASCPRTFGGRSCSSVLFWMQLVLRDGGPESKDADDDCQSLGQRRHARGAGGERSTHVALYGACDGLNSARMKEKQRRRKWLKFGYNLGVMSRTLVLIKMNDEM